MPHQHPQADYSTWNCTKYNWLKDTMQSSCEQALAVVRDGHWLAVVESVNTAIGNMRKVWTHQFKKVRDCKTSYTSTKIRWRITTIKYDLHSSREIILLTCDKTFILTMKQLHWKISVLQDSLLHTQFDIQYRIFMPTQKPCLLAQ